jgi:hypothetical protein
MRYLSSVLVSCLLCLSANSFAAQQQNANLYVNWKVTSSQNYTALSQELQITQKAPGTFWASSWYFTGVNYGGYMGLQTSYDGTGNEIAIFSVWNATTGSSSCKPFGGEGVGMSCTINYPINTTHQYKLLLSKGTNNSSGQTWNAYVLDVNTSTQTLIGSVQAPSSVTTFTLPANFTEYFGNAVSTCNDVPVSMINWYQPALTAVNSYYPTNATYSNYTRGSCTGGSASSALLNYYIPIVKVTMGGAQ